MKGFDKSIDWAKLTFENRILDTEVPYAQVAEPWQLEIDTAIQNYLRIYLQLARGHDKTDRFAWWSLLWLASTHASKGYCAGVDRDNAALFRDSSRKLKQLHPQLFAPVEVQKNLVINRETGSHIETISSDADSAYGLNFDLLIINDFHAWPDKKFFEVLWTACEKKPDIRVWIESNALTYGSEGYDWVYKQRKWVKEIGSQRVLEGSEQPEWWFYCPRGFLASWQKRKLEQWKETLHPASYKRLIENEDTSEEESYLTPEQVEAVSTLPTRKEEEYNKNGVCVTALDLGIRRDATAIATIQSLPVTKGSPPKLRLLSLEVITGSTDDPVLLERVERTLMEHKNKFSSRPILVDPWNTQFLVQKYPSLIEEWTFTTAHIRELTLNLYRAIADKHLLIYKDAGRAIQNGEEWTLQRELVQAVLKDCSYGQRVDHKAGGFSDRLMSVGMCVHYLMSSRPPLAREEPRKEQKDKWESGKVIDGWNEELKKPDGKGLVIL